MTLTMLKKIKHLANTLHEDLQAVLERDPAARNRVEVLLTYPGIHALILHRGAHSLWQHNLKGLAKGIAYGSRMLTGIEIHPAAQIGRRFFIDHGMGVVIGETAQIGDDVTLYHGVTLGGVSTDKGKRHPTLKDGVVVGAGAKVLGPFTVGKNAKIGSNAVVVKAVPAGATMVGDAARMIQAKTKTKNTAQPQLNRKHEVFLAYGVSPNSTDPVADGFAKLLEHIEQSDKQIKSLQQAICKLDPNYCKEDLKRLTADDIDVIEKY